MPTRSNVCILRLAVHPTPKLIVGDHIDKFKHQSDAVISHRHNCMPTI